MFNQTNSPRATLISVTRSLLQTADDARAVPELLPYLATTDAALTRFQARHSLALVAADRASAQVLSAQQAESEADRRVSAFAGRLRAEATGGDAVAEAAMQRLFPAGVSRLTHYTGRTQLTHYLTFRERLSETALPTLLEQAPAQLYPTLDGFAAALELKEQLKIQLRTAQREVRAAEQALKQALVNLERVSGIYLTEDQMRAWSEPARSMGRAASPRAVEPQKLAA